MKDEKDIKPMVQATEEVPLLEIGIAHEEVHKLVKDSGFSKPKIAECIGATRQMLHLALTTDKYPFILIRVLKCLGYKTAMKLDLEIINEGEGDA